MAAQAAECAAMTDGAGGLVQVELARTVCAHESGYVAGRLEVSVGCVALLATERVVDLVVAYQAIRHFRHVRGGNLVALRQTAMTRLARVRGVEMAADVAGR